MDTINWDDQWASFSPYYKNGYAQIPLEDFGGKRGSIKLKPGPGFGDLSHPTTRLCLKFLCQENLKGKTVFDIGCGSGILSLAAAKLEASFVFGVDIDPQAVEHAQINARINALEKACAFHLSPFRPKQKIDLILLNMISSEQNKALSPFPEGGDLWIVSGIPLFEKEEYLQKMEEKGLVVKTMKELDNWLAFTLCPA